MSFIMAVDIQLGCFISEKTSHHVDDGRGHGLEVHGALPLLGDVGVGPHHGLVGVVEAEGHGVPAHVKPLQGLHPGRVRFGERISHSHLQRKGVNTLKVNFSENQTISAWENIGRYIEEIAGAVPKKSRYRVVHCAAE